MNTISARYKKKDYSINPTTVLTVGFIIEDISIHIECKMLKARFLILLLIFFIPNSSCLFTDIIEIDTLLTNAITQLNRTGGLNVTVNNLKAIFFGRNGNVSHGGQMLPSESNEVYEAITIKLNSSKEFMTFLPRGNLLKNLESEIAINIRLIDTLFRSYLEQFEGIGQDPMESAHLKLPMDHHAWHAKEQLSILRSMLTSRLENSWDDGLLNSLVNGTFDDGNRYCGGDEIIKNDLINMHKIILSSEIKVHLMQAIDAIHQIGYVSPQQQQDWLNDFNKYLIAYTESLSGFLEAMEAVEATHFRFCDAQYNSWIQDVSSFELHEFLREKIFLFNRSGCNSTCSEIWHKNECKKLSPKFLTCEGNLMALAEANIRNVCVLRGPEFRYDWISFPNGVHFGKQTQSCPESKGFKLLTDEEALANIYSSCWGQCSRDIWGIYLGLIESREDHNYVIVGMRFVLRDKVLYLQPAEGLVGIDGKITNFSWISFPKKIPERKIAKVNLEWHSFFLDDLQLGPEHVLTGIRIRHVRKGYESKIKGFAISIRGRRLDFRTGKLNLTSEHKIVKDISSNPQRELPLTLMRPPPDEILRRQEPSPREYTYVKLQQSDFITDLGQSTLPLFDSTPVILQQHSALNGIGIFHKGSKDHAGFISLRLYPISYVSPLQIFIKTHKTNKMKI